MLEHLYPSRRPLIALALAVLPILVLHAPQAVVAAERAYVSNFQDSTLSVLDLGGPTPTVLHTVAVGAGAAGVVVDNSGHLVLVTNLLDNSVSVIDAGASPPVDLHAVPVGALPVAFGRFIGPAPTLFADGFENGDLAAWSAVVGASSGAKLLLESKNSLSGIRRTQR